MVRKAATVLVAGAATLLLACSGGNNNKNNAAAPATTTSSRPVTPVAGTASTAAAVPAGRTATAAAVRTGTAAPSAAAPRVTATPGGARDAALQQQLQSAALQPADLPSGYAQAGDADTSIADPSQVAGYALTFTQVNQTAGGVGIQAIYDGLFAFKDAASAQAQFSNVKNQFTQNAGGDFQLQPLQNGPKIGDDTLSFSVSGQTSGLTVSGYAIVWRRGRIASVIVQLGTPAIQGVDTTAGIAQKQDAKIQNIR
jgi:hypothetical protein